METGNRQAEYKEWVLWNPICLLDESYPPDFQEDTIASRVKCYTEWAKYKDYFVG